MLKLLKRWLGWDSDSGPFDFSDLRITRHRSPTSPPVPPAQPTAIEQPKAARPGAQPQTRRQAQPPRKPKAKDKNKERAPMDVLDNPRLTLDRPKNDGFDPYNTGAFNRSTSWERIGRNKKR